MQVAQVIGGYSLGGADLLRRAMGKKKPEEMAKHRDDLPRGRGEEGHRRGGRRRALRPDGEVRRLRLQQVARRRVRAARLPDGVVQGAPRGRVHGRQHVGRDGRHRQAEGAARRRARPSASTIAAARRQRAAPTASSRSTPKRVRYGLGAIKGTGAGRDRGDRRGARGRRPVPQPVRLLPPRRPAPRQPARRRGAGQGRRVRRAAPERARRCSRASASRSTGPTRRRRTPTRAACSTSATSHARREHAGAGARRRRAVEHQGAADAREGGARLLPLGPPVRPERGRGAALRQAAHRRPDRQPRAAAARRHRRRPARRQRPARPGRDLQARRHERADRGGRQRGAARTPTATC